VSPPAALAGLPGETTVCATADACAASLAAALGEHLRQRLAGLPSAHVALSGGSSGELLCARLAEADDIRPAEWPRIHLWMVDERQVADGDPRLNFRLLRDRLAPQVPLPAANLHPMPVMQARGDALYERELRAALDQRPDARERRLDAVMLGMGADGHTASLFPQTSALDERERWIVRNDGDRIAPPRPRLTMTYPVLNQARFIALLVTGAGKQAALRRVADRREDYRSLPVAGIAPAAGSRLVWYIDETAVPTGSPSS
jgi:6-phosphogluconolactonase